MRVKGATAVGTGVLVGISGSFIIWPATENSLQTELCSFSGMEHIFRTAEPITRSEFDVVFKDESEVKGFNWKSDIWFLIEVVGI